MAEKIKDFFSDNKNLFLQVSDDQVHNSLHGIDKSLQYTMLNYPKIMNEICEYLEGYAQFEENNDTDKKKYSVQEISTQTTKFFNSMFTDQKYRVNCVLEDVPIMNRKFLELSKKLKSFLDTHKEGASGPMKVLCVMSENQFMKVGKVLKDDLKIYLWLLYRANGKDYSIPSKTRVDFKDKKTPVMHPKD